MFENTSDLNGKCYMYVAVVLLFIHFLLQLLYADRSGMGIPRSKLEST
jgi:hypothetical protein